MATFKPFKALRPRTDLASEIAALPYDVYSREEAKEAAGGNGYSFLHVDKSEIDLEDTIDNYDDRVYQKAGENLDNMINNGWLIFDDTPSFYIYQITMGEVVQTGITSLLSINEYLDKTIKRHEFTREDKERDRVRHIEALNAQTGPIFIAYEAKTGIKKITGDFIKSNPSVYRMHFDDGTIHEVWRITDSEIISSIENEAGDIPNLFIADGHHRSAAAVKVGLSRRDGNDGDKASEYFLSVIFPHDELYIMDYNRVVKDLNGLSADEFIRRLELSFDVTENEGKKPGAPHEFGMYLQGRWYMLKLKRGLGGTDPLNSLDVSILQNLVLDKILNITDIRNDKRIDFIGGIRGLEEIKRRVDSGEMAAGFAMFPTSVRELFDVALMDEVMPPKSTWFEPKLRSGIFIHKI